MTIDAPDPVGLALFFAASIVGGGVNAIAGGGTILTFAVLAAVLPPGADRLVSANMTSTIALWPGSVAATWAHRHEWAKLPRQALWLLVPSIAGAIIGVVLLQVLPAKSFDMVVPWLILVAAVLFAVQPWVTKLVTRRSQREGSPPDPTPPAATTRPAGLVFAFQLLVGIYGGYFGAGIGILMLASLGLLGLGEIHALNAVKNLLATAVNGVATMLFVIAAITGGFEVSWLHVAAGAAGSILGGTAVAKIARRLPATAVRRAVAIIAFALAGYHLWKEFS